MLLQSVARIHKHAHFYEMRQCLRKTGYQMANRDASRLRPYSLSNPNPTGFLPHSWEPTLFCTHLLTTLWSSGFRNHGPIFILLLLEFRRPIICLLILLYHLFHLHCPKAVPWHSISRRSWRACCGQAAVHWRQCSSSERGHDAGMATKNVIWEWESNPLSRGVAFFKSSAIMDQKFFCPGSSSMR